MAGTYTLNKTKYIISGIILLVWVQIIPAQVVVPFVLSSAGAAAPVTHYFDTLSYAGTGEAQDITVSTLDPVVVIIKGAKNGAVTCNAATVLKTSTMGTDSAAHPAVVAALLANMVTLGDNKFTVGTDTSVNKNGAIYHVQVWGAYEGKLEVGKYVGSGADNRDLALSISPQVFLTKPAAAAGARIRFATVSGDSTQNFITSAGLTDCIQSVGTNTVQLGTSANVNANGTVYHYVAFDTVAGYVWQFKYLGNATADRDVSVTTAQPNAVWLSANNTFERVFGISTMTNNYNCVQWSASAIEYQYGLKQFNADGFRVTDGARTNPNNAFVHGIAFKVH